jgi:hypothetical protein
MPPMDAILLVLGTEISFYELLGISWIAYSDRDMKSLYLWAVLMRCFWLLCYSCHSYSYNMTSINTLHVLAPGCHSRGVFQIREIQAQHAKLGSALHVVPSVVCWTCIPFFWKTPWEWFPGTETCKILILIMNLLSALVGWCMLIIHVPLML